MLTGTVQLWCIATKRFKPTYLGCNISIGIRNISNFFLARTRRAHITIFQDILPNASDSHSSINLSLSRYVQEPFNCIASLKNRLGRVCYRKKRRSWNCRGEVRLVHHLAAIRLLITRKSHTAYVPPEWSQVKNWEDGMTNKTKMPMTKTNVEDDDGVRWRTKLRGLFAAADA